jgi:hypothetical protein
LPNDGQAFVEMVKIIDLGLALVQTDEAFESLQRRNKVNNIFKERMRAYFERQSIFPGNAPEAIGRYGAGPKI